MVLKADQERVKTLLSETITLLCKNGLHYQSEFSIEGLIGITIDKNEIFLVSLKETFHIPPSCETSKRKNATPVKMTFKKTSEDSLSSDSVEFLNNSDNGKTASNTTRTKKTSRLSSSSANDLPKNNSTGFLSQNHFQEPLSEYQESFLKKSDCEDNSSHAPFLISDKTDTIYIDALDATEIKTEAEFEDEESAKDILIDSMDCVPIDKREEFPFDIATRSRSVSETCNESNKIYTGTRSFSATNREMPNLLAHVKTESTSDQNEGASNASSYPTAGGEVDSMVQCSAFIQKLQESYRKQSANTFQRGALETNVNLNVNISRLDPWPSGQRPVRKAGSGSGSGISGKRHTCQICNKSFTFASALTHHENNIHGRRPHPFKCFICSKGFWNQRSMRGHMTSKHLMQTEYCCPICHKEYAYKVSLRDHMKLYHNMTL